MTVIWDILFPCGDRLTSNAQEKLRTGGGFYLNSHKIIIINLNLCFKHERAQDDAYGTGVTVCEKQYATFDTSIF